MLLGYEQVRIDGRLYTDGGLLGALPVWAAAELGAQRVIAVDALPVMPSRTVRVFLRAIRALAPGARGTARVPEVAVVAPSKPLGALRDAVFWRRAAVERWIARGEADARGISLE